MEARKRDFLVGCFVLVAGIMAGIFFWLLGAFSLVRTNPTYILRFSFAGGIEVGAPVRVSGVKVGRVETIDFLEGVEGTDRTAIEVTVSVARKAVGVIRQDSRFFVNIAGIIGERYVEISPGSPEAPVLEPGSRIRAVDPPRIDQLISQGYGVFGRVHDFLDQNEKTITAFLNQLTRLLNDTTKILEKTDRAKLESLVDNLIQISNDIRALTHELRGPKSAEFLEKLQTILERAHAIDKRELKKFLQEEGVRARIF